MTLQSKKRRHYRGCDIFLVPPLPLQLLQIGNRPQFPLSQDNDMYFLKYYEIGHFLLFLFDNKIRCWSTPNFIISLFLLYKDQDTLPLKYPSFMNPFISYAH